MARTTVIFQDAIFERLKQVSHGNVSAFLNKLLWENLFEKKKSLGFGMLKGKVKYYGMSKEDLEWRHDEDTNR